MTVLFSAITPTASSPHLGNYLGALSQWLTLPREKAYFAIADLHALTRPAQKPETFQTACALLALGIHKQPNTVVFRQSKIREHAMLQWVLACWTSTGMVDRMTQFKAKGAGNVGLYTYPILQAADILLYKTTHVPVGQDQAQHIELARDIAQRFNRQFPDTFTIPNLLLSEHKKIQDLRNPLAKMSKSSDEQGTIFLTDEPAIIRKKIMRAVTDSISGVKIDSEDSDRPGIRNLIQIYRACGGRGDMHAWDSKTLKHHSAEQVILFLAQFQNEFRRLSSSPKEVIGVLEQGEAEALTVAKQVWQRVTEEIGL